VHFGRLHNTTTGIQISDQWKNAGTGPGALPTGNINIFNLSAGGGGNPNDTNSIVDLINGNTLTQSGGNLAVGYYLFGPGGVMTSANPESTLVNAFDINGNTLAIYSGSSSAPAFSAAPTAVSIGTGTNLSGLSLNGGNSLTSQTGTGGTIAMSGSPALTGTPTATTQPSTDNSTRIATTAFVQSHLPQVVGSVSRLSQTSNISGTLVTSPTTGTYMLSLCLWVQTTSASGTVIASVSYNNGHNCHERQQRHGVLLIHFDA